VFGNKWHEACCQQQQDVQRAQRPPSTACHSRVIGEARREFDVILASSKVPGERRGFSSRRRAAEKRRREALQRRAQ